MAQDFIGMIGGIKFVSGGEAFRKCAEAQKTGRFGKVQPKITKKKKQK